MLRKKEKPYRFALPSSNCDSALVETYTKSERVYLVLADVDHGTFLGDSIDGLPLTSYGLVCWVLWVGSLTTLSADSVFLEFSIWLNWMFSIEIDSITSSVRYWVTWEMLIRMKNREKRYGEIGIHVFGKYLCYKYICDATHLLKIETV